MRSAGIFVAVCILLSSPGFARAQVDPLKKEELRWAKEVLTDFLTAASKEQNANAAALLTKELNDSTQLKTPPFFWQNLVGKKLGSLSQEEILVGQDEAVFRGVLTGGDQEYDFVARVTKEQERKVWRICYFSMTERKKAK
jgi:hypothetical protein